MSSTMKNFSFCHFLLLSAAVASCILQVALARPVKRGVESQQIKFAIQSPFSGNFIRMTESGAIDTSRDFTQLSAQWFLRTNEDGYALENCEFRGHYLVIASLGDTTVLYGQDSLAPLTRRDVEHLLGHEGSGSLAVAVSETGEGSLSPTAASSATEEESMSAPTAASSATEEESMSAPTAASSEAGLEELQFTVMSDWIIETTASLMTRFRTVSRDRDCYLAVDRDGVPENNLCQVPGDSDSVVMKFLPILVN